MTKHGRCLIYIRSIISLTKSGRTEVNYGIHMVPSYALTH